MLAPTTVLFNGITAAVADVALNDLSRRNDFALLRAYFLEHSILQAAAYASLTVMVGAVAVLLVTRAVAGFCVPRTLGQTAVALSASFAVGWAMDVAIKELRVFPLLDAYYARHGAGLWGALSLVVSMAISLAAQAFVLPLLTPDDGEFPGGGNLQKTEQSHSQERSKSAASECRA